MRKVGFFKFLVIFLFTVPCFGQKVKYKDIYGLLRAKQYDAAEPVLKQYLASNDDTPSAYLYMGLILEEKSSRIDILKQTDPAISMMDSSIFFLNKAYATITEKEVKRHDEYYEIYNRRDLRTGEFGVKLSDIQFDLEKKRDALKARIDQVKMVKHYFTLADTLYKKSTALFTGIQLKYPTQKEFFLRADDALLQDLKNLSIRFDSCTKAFDHYKTSLGNLGKTGYNQSYTLIDINDFALEGKSGANFFMDEVKLWNYKKFASASEKVIKEEILPMREHLIAYDIEINNLREKLKTDSISVKSELTKIIDELLADKLKKFDPDPLPLNLFALKIADLEYRSTVIENHKNKDSLDVHLKLEQISNELGYLHTLDIVANKLFNSDLDAMIANYNHFVENTYSNAVVLKSYIKALKEFAEREQREKSTESERYKEAMLWLNVGEERVPLSTEVDHEKYKMLLLEEERYTVGLAYADSITMTGYFYTITPSRTPDITVSIKVDPKSFKLSTLSGATAMVASDKDDHIYYILYLSAVKEGDKFSTTLSKVYRADGLAWTNPYQLDLNPTEIRYKEDNGDVIIVLSDGQLVTIDKNGKVLKEN